MARRAHAADRKQVRLTLPVPPPLNHRMVIIRGRFVKSQKDRAYKTTVGKIAHGSAMLTDDLFMDVIWYRARRAGDIDGRLKPLLDSLTGVCYLDDKQIKKLHIRIDDTQKNNPRMDVCIESLSPSQL